MRVENSFIPVRGVGETTERRLWRRGITHWDAFDPAAVGPRTGRRILAYIDEATDRLAAADSTFFGETFPDREHWRLYETFREDACFLDIETTGLDRRSHAVTVVSTHRGGGTTTLVRGDDLTRTRLTEALAGASMLVTFNGKRFDVPFLESALGLSIDLPHLDLMYPCRRIGLHGGLKRIERTLGIDRDEADISGLDAVRLWHAHERHGDDDALETLITYNREDTVNLVDLAETVVDRLHASVFDAARPGRQTRLDEGEGPGGAAGENRPPP